MIFSSAEILYTRIWSPPVNVVASSPLESSGLYAKRVCGMVPIVAEMRTASESICGANSSSCVQDESRKEK